MVCVCPNVPDHGRYSIKDTAELLQVSRFTVMRRINDGWIRKATYADNGRPYITGKEIKRYFRSVSDSFFV